MSYYKIRPRGGTASQWTTANPVLTEREIGFEYPDGGLGTGLVKMKMGNGVTHWNDLPYAETSMIESIGDQETSPASTSHSPGDLIIYKNQLYRVTASISQGDALTVGTNITATNIVQCLDTISDSMIQGVTPNQRKMLTIENGSITPDVDGWVVVGSTADSSISIAPVLRITADSQNNIVIAEAVGAVVANGIFHCGFIAKAGQTYYIISYRATTKDAIIFY